MFHNPKRRVVRCKTAADRSLVRVALPTGAYAEIDGDDFDLVAQTYGTNWHLNPNGKGQAYVSVHNERRDGRLAALSVARIITNARPGQRVRYNDGDRLNLRRENLRKVGRGRG